MKRKTVFASLTLLLTSFQPLLAQNLRAVSNTIDCGQVLYQHPAVATFEITNYGTSAFTITDVRKSCGCTAVDYPTTSIAPGATFNVSVTYDAQQMGTFHKEVALYTTNEDKPYYLTIQGKVVGEIVDFVGSYPFVLGDLNAETNNVEFDDVNRGDFPVQKIHIHNRGSKILKPVVMHLPSYIQANVSPSTIAPGHGGVVSLTLNSRMLRDFGLTQTSVFLGMYPGDKVSENKEITISAILLPNFSDLTDAQLKNSPQIEISTDTLNLGMFGKKRIKKGIVEIKNTGSTTLKIRSLQMFTSGLKVSLNKTSLEPGETARLKITAEEKLLKTARSMPRVLMITNDPKRAKVVIHIQTK